MRSSVLAALAASVAAVALPQQAPGGDLAPALSLDTYKNTPKPIKPVPLEVAASKFKNETGVVLPAVKEVIGDILDDVKAAINTTLHDIIENTKINARDHLEMRDSELHVRGSCQNPRVRQEWDGMSDSDKSSFVSAIQCLMSRPSRGGWSNSRSRYEDFVSLHQRLTPNVHGNAKFLIWHRYFLWTFEDTLRSECGFNTAFPWWDETRYAGRFGQSSVFQWFGTSNSGGGCVTDGAFGGLTLDIGPGTTTDLNPHCLQRQTDEGATSNVNYAYVQQCHAWGDFLNMASCNEGGPHAWGHNGIGGAMGDMFASPGDPVFWLHHAFVDRIFRIWQNVDGNRQRGFPVSDINNGNTYPRDSQGNVLTMDMTVNVYDFRPTVRIGDILDTTDPTLCYRYNY